MAAIRRQALLLKSKLKKWQSSKPARNCLPNYNAAPTAFKKFRYFDYIRLSELFIFIVFDNLFLYLLNFYCMGRGDKKTKKGKIFKGSFGKSRPAKPKKAAG